MKKQGKRQHKTLLVSAIAVAAGLAVVAGALVALRGRDSCRAEGAVSVSVNGMVFRWPEGLLLLHNDGGTYLKDREGKRRLDSYPLILEDSGELLLQRSMIWTQTGEDRIKRLDYFGRVGLEEDGAVLSRGQAEARGADGFLYDGEDTYIFLEPVELSWNGERSMTLEPLTVVQVGYRQYIHIYGPGMEPIFEELTQEEVLVRFAGGKRANLATDLYFMPNGTWRLLFMSMELLEAIK